MSSPSDKQIAFIRSLVTERETTISEMPEDDRRRLLVPPQSSRDASLLIDRLMRIPADPKPADEGEVARVDGLASVVAQLDGRDRSFASDLIAQYRRTGRLSEKQWSWVDRLTTKATTPAPAPLEVGLYQLPDGTIVKVYLTQAGRIASKVLEVLGNGRGSFRYRAGILASVRAEHRLTEEQAQAFGRQHAFCVACARSLDDDRSLAVGYGPVCASQYGWFYPNAEQASEMLGRPIRCQHRMHAVETVTHYSSPQLGTHSETVTYKCEHCDHTESRLEGNYYSGD